MENEFREVGSERQLFSKQGTITRAREAKRAEGYIIFAIKGFVHDKDLVTMESIRFYLVENENGVFMRGTQKVEK